MSITDTSTRDDSVQLLKAKAAFVLHELVDRVAHATEGDRLEMHAQVAELCDGVSHAAARDSVADPEAYLAAHAEGAYDAPTAPAAPPTADQLRIAELQAQIDAMTAAQPEPAAAPTAEQFADLQARIDAMNAAQPTPATPGQDTSTTPPPPAGDTTGTDNPPPAPGATDGTGS